MVCRGPASPRPRRVPRRLRRGSGPVRPRRCSRRVPLRCRRALPRLLCALALLLLGVDLFLRLNAGVTRSLSLSLSPEP